MGPDGVSVTQAAAVRASTFAGRAREDAARGAAAAETGVDLLMAQAAAHAGGGDVRCAIPEFAPGDIAVDAATLLGPPGSYGAVHPATLTATGAPVAVKVSSFDLCWTVWCLSWAPPGLHL